MGWGDSPHGSYSDNSILRFLRPSLPIKDRIRPRSITMPMQQLPQRRLIVAIASVLALAFLLTQLWMTSHSPKAYDQPAQAANLFYCRTLLSSGQKNSKYTPHCCNIPRRGNCEVALRWTDVKFFDHYQHYCEFGKIPDCCWFHPYVSYFLVSTAVILGQDLLRTTK